jgi:hypothetical protein
MLFLLKLFPSSKRPFRLKPKRIMVGDGQLENHARRSAQLLRFNQLPLNLIKLELPELWMRKRDPYTEGIKKAILIPDQLDYYNQRFFNPILKITLAMRKVNCVKILDKIPQFTA